jgi:hypothetical protein
MSKPKNNSNQSQSAKPSFQVETYRKMLGTGRLRKALPAKVVRPTKTRYTKPSKEGSASMPTPADHQYSKRIITAIQESSRDFFSESALVDSGIRLPVRVNTKNHGGHDALGGIKPENPNPLSSAFLARFVGSLEAKRYDDARSFVEHEISNHVSTVGQYSAVHGLLLAAFAECEYARGARESALRLTKQARAIVRESISKPNKIVAILNSNIAAITESQAAGEAFHGIRDILKALRIA